MTYIELVRALRGRVGMQGTGPNSISSASGAQKDLVDVVRDAWLDIQNSRIDWKWLRASKDFLTVAGTKEYSLVDIFITSTPRFGRWLVDSCYITIGTKKSRLIYLHYDLFIDRTQNQVGGTTPRYFTVRPWDNAILITPPDKVYTISIDYQKSPQELTDDSDVPELPTHFHNIIIYSAIEKYSVIVSSSELFHKYSSDYSIMWGNLARSELPRKRIKMRSIA